MTGEDHCKEDKTLGFQAGKASWKSLKRPEFHIEELLSLSGARCRWCKLMQLAAKLVAASWPNLGQCGGD